MITKEQRQVIYNTMDVLVEIEKQAWEKMKTKDGLNFKCRAAELHDKADKAWWALNELWKYFNI